MSLDLPNWDQDHVVITDELTEFLSQGFTIYIKIKPENRKIKTEISILKKSSTKGVTISHRPMAVHPQDYMPDALDLLGKGFTLNICVKPGITITVTAEKHLQ